MTSVGTVRKNKREIPPQLVKNKGRQPETSEFVFQNDITLVSYVPKNNKLVLVASTMHHDQAVDKTNKNLPEIISFYNYTKGGVDVVDELCANYDVSRTTERWSMCVFYNILNMATVNGNITYNANNQCKKDRRDYIRELILALVNEHIARRAETTTVRRSVKDNMTQFSQKQTSENVTPKKHKSIIFQKKTRCHFCERNTDRKTQYRCNKCSKPVCLTHAVMFCEPCDQEQGEAFE